VSVPPIVMALLGPAVAAAVWRAGLLTTGGAVAAAVLGALCAAAGIDWMLLLLAFFASSVALGRVGRAEKQRRSERVIEKSGPRDATQVFANGGVFGACALGMLINPTDLLRTLALGSLCAAAADTWGTEVGMLSRRAPRHVLTWQPITPGMSGGITLLGMAATALGAICVAAFAAQVAWPVVVAVAGSVGGFCGALVDSLLGASLQSRRRDATGALTERPRNADGTPTVSAGGLRWMTNDAVNIFSIIAGACVAAAFFVVFAS
jgi:uncharacterized protein (TIGR00297 family)